MAGCDMSVASAARPALVNECRRRLTFQERPATQSLGLVLLLWYGVEIVMLYLGWTVAQWQWVFTTESFPALSPGLVLATISHDPANVTHVLGSVGFIWLFAGESEQHMRGFEVLGFFLATGLVSVTVNTAVTGESTLGASGGALAFVGFYGAHLLLAHRDALAVDTSDDGPVDMGALRAAAVLLPVGFGLFELVRYAGVVPAGETAVLGHLVGLVVGAGYAVGRG